MDSRLTDGTIAEILMRHGELLQAYQNQIRELTEEYNTGNELIEITQLRSPRYGVVGKSSNQASLDQVYEAVEKQRKEYCSMSQQQYLLSVGFLLIRQTRDQRRKKHKKKQ